MKWSELLEKEDIGLQRERMDVEVVAHFTVPGEPVSKARARADTRDGKIRHYTPKDTSKAEEFVGWWLRESGYKGRPDAVSTFGAFCGFYCKSRRDRDTDNLCKLVFDAINGLIWKDDSQITEHSVLLHRQCADPRTEVVIYRT